MNTKKQKAFKCFIIAVRLALGRLFIYAGIQKFKSPEPKPAKALTEVSQAFALLGGIVLLPVTLNIFLFEVFLGGGHAGEIFVHGLYLLGNLLILTCGYPRLKLAFITSERKFHNITS